MKVAFALLSPALLLAAIPAVAAPRDVPYRAIGTEPGWALTIERGLIRYVGDYGRTKVTVAAPVPRPSFNGLRYVTSRLSVDITHTRCIDTVSDREFPDRVTVNIGRTSVHGCGGIPIDRPIRVPVIEGSWRIETIGGIPVRGGRSATIAFAGDRITGDSGCNSFGGSFRFDRGTLTPGPMISTKMACATPVMAQEQAIFHLLAEPLSVTERRDGRLVLSGGGARTMVLTRDSAH